MSPNEHLLAMIDNLMESVASMAERTMNHEAQRYLMEVRKHRVAYAELTEGERGSP